MVMLTEEMVIARTKQSNLASITKLNCWGAQLSDVTILRRMPNVTVLSLSVNSINTLADFQFCAKLTDLFVRKNNIRDLNEVCYLKDLNSLKTLFLDENPCVINSKDENYRYSVIRALPQLQKLDESAVEPTEAERAVRLGKVLVHPEQQEEYYSDPDDESPDRYIEEKDSDVVSSVRQAQGWQEPVPQYTSSEPDRESSPEPTPVYRPIERTQNIVNHESEESLDVYPPPANMRNNQHYNSMPRSRTTDGELGYCQEYNRRFSRSSCTNSCGGRRPAERKTNILNAVLCLIKELDYHNLEVVEMAVKCRMDELDG